MISEGKNDPNQQVVDLGENYNFIVHDLFFKII
jgi:hypothetical protein